MNLKLKQLQNLINEKEELHSSISGDMLYSCVTLIQRQRREIDEEIYELSNVLFDDFVSVLKRNKHLGKYDRTCNRYTCFNEFVELNDTHLTLNLRYDNFDEPDEYDDVQIPLIAFNDEKEFAKQQEIAIVQHYIECNKSNIERLEHQLNYQKERLVENENELNNLMKE